ncbi:2-oxoglutarate dehydrogenase E1 component [Acidiluteibacter ferrifornacis]|uniref:oxoglutarate dehydrogenase (succinyl-transferring) n=1 Tax=Acidiluteibacter ferrifornacis TaxID=2692424 RepID=A0A6N9NIU9_9FLAO|nr:2-oxoglutarate dehydrogenase E1 component [Acidiluteibacter ferrifornacis]NBG65130.1 2-oxoglutarate dehydrogenase E1 component [Acidiluteibacter ferrifornacis]
MDKFSYLSNADVTAIDTVYQQYLKDPKSVDEGWSKFFDGFEFARKNYEQEVSAPSGSLNFDKEFKVINLINAYRSRGHLFTKTNPVRERRKYTPTLDVENFGLTQEDLSKVFQAGTEIGLKDATLQQVIDFLKETYCHSIGVEYMYIRKPDKVDWLKNKMEGSKNKGTFTNEEKKHILHKLNQAVVFEQFLHKKFVGQKRFSLEGGESLIPALDAAIELGAKEGVEEFVVGMAHRGRLNVLANIFNKTYKDIFSEFEGKEYEDNLFDGDVKYHLGYSCDIKTDSGKDVKLTLSPNPSHLEAVGPVVAGIARSKVDQYLHDDQKIVPIIIHGDASIAGQGVVYELIQMASLDAYKTGGAIHIVINNQIGFTTNYLDARSSTYCTDVGKVTLSPIFHVNGDDPEAVVYTIKLALEFRQKYKKDVFVDLLCYRKYGHNEGDEPRFTQPLLYKAIAKHKNPREIYLDNLISLEVLNKEAAKQMEKKFNDMLQDRLTEAKQIEKAVITPFLAETWKGLRESTDADMQLSVDTSYDKKKLIEVGKSISTLPSDMNFFKKSEKLFSERLKMIESEVIDWGMAELLAYSTLLTEGFPVRMTGQDVERGTFSHRHAVLKVEDSEEEYIPLNHIPDTKEKFEIYNSLLSEYAVLGFEYGYAMATPYGLTIWEAQFGDFNNGAQIIIDQFLSSAEDKWKSQNGLVMLLPHGYEGQGAEHSSARLERFLTLCGDYNMQVANCTTPANYFHILRRQLKREFRKPLVMMTPKSLLRHAKCVSTLDELATGKFQEVIDDVEVKAQEVNTIAFCSGKIYYELIEKREELGANDVAVVRMEQFYPFPQKQVDAILEKYKQAKNTLWVQEEPENMGAWSFILRNFKSKVIKLISRRESASPAAGSSKVFAKRQAAVINGVFEYSEVKK